MSWEAEVEEIKKQDALYKVILIGAAYKPLVRVVSKKPFCSRVQSAILMQAALA